MGNFPFFSIGKFPIWAPIKLYIDIKLVSVDILIFETKQKKKNTDLCQFILILSASLWPYNILHTGPWAESFFKLGEIFENFRLLLFGQAVQGVLVDNASAFILALTLLELGEVNC